MTPKSRSVWITALAAGLLATAAATSAGAFGRHGGPPGVDRLERRLDRMDLSADLRAKAIAIVDASRAEERALREKARAAHEQLAAMLRTGEPDPEAVDAQIEAIGALHTQQHKQFLHALLQVGALLPEDQRAQWFAPPHRGEHHRDRGER